jgi:hypothetical protein
MRSTSSRAPALASMLAVGVVLAVKEAPLLMPVDRIIRGIENDLLRRLRMSVEEEVDEGPLDRSRIMTNFVIARWPGCGRVLEPVQRRLASRPCCARAGGRRNKVPPRAGQRRAVRAPARRELSGEHGEYRIVPQVVVVDEVLIAERDPEDALADQRWHRVFDPLGGTSVLMAKRSIRRIARSVAPSSRAPASEVLAPPSNAATTARPSTGANPNRSALHSVGIGELL